MDIRGRRGNALGVFEPCKVWSIEWLRSTNGAEARSNQEIDYSLSRSSFHRSSSTQQVPVDACQPRLENDILGLVKRRLALS